MNIFLDFQIRIGAILQRLSDVGTLPQGLDLAKVTVEPPRDAAHGDLSTNAAMVFAKEAKAAGSGPRELAVEIAASLAADADVDQAEVAGAGFINILLRSSVYERILSSVLSSCGRYGAGAATGRAVNVEYVSANPTGPLHVGHARGAVFGNALASLLEFSGRAVAREYYINDAGAQVDVLARSAYLRYREALGENVSIGDGLYPGDYLKPVGQAIASEFGASLVDTPEMFWLPKLRERAIAAMMKLIREDLASLNVTHEVFSSERDLTGAAGGPNQVHDAIEALRARGLIYEGRLEPPKGGAAEDWEDRVQTLFRSRAFGDDVDRALMKSDGSYTYFAADIAYHKTKLDRGFFDLVDVLGADHGGYVKRMQAAVKALSDGKARLDVRQCQLVRLMRAGEPVKMSKRSGSFVTLRDVVDEVGADAVRFIMLMRKNDAPLDFDLAKVIEQSQDNPVFYVQYAHARASSVLRQAQTAFPDLDTAPTALAKADLSLLEDAGERSILRLLAQYPRVIGQAAEAREPHRLAFFAHELGGAFHSHWNRGKDSPSLRFIVEARKDVSQARIALVAGLRLVLASALSILGVSAPEEMR